MFYRLLPGAEKLKPQDEDVENDSGESNNYSGRPSQLSNIFTLLAQIYTPLTTTFACILLLLNLNQWRQPRADWDSRVVGHMGQIETVFSGSEEWESLDPQYDLLWEQYTSGAELMVEDTEVEQEDKIPASISMIHQLHCLGAMRKALRDARPLDDKEAGHLSHCLDYVRMGITCCADSTVEVPHVENGHRVPFIDGKKTAHQCRSAAPILELRERLGPADPNWAPWEPRGSG